MPKPSSVPIFSAHIDTEQQPGTAHLLQDDHNHMLLTAMKSIDLHRTPPPHNQNPSQQALGLNSIGAPHQLKPSPHPIQAPPRKTGLKEYANIRTVLMDQSAKESPERKFPYISGIPNQESYDNICYGGGPPWSSPQPGPTQSHQMSQPSPRSCPRPPRWLVSVSRQHPHEINPTAPLSSLAPVWAIQPGSQYPVVLSRMGWSPPPLGHRSRRGKSPDRPSQLIAIPWLQGCPNLLF